MQGKVILFSEMKPDASWIDRFNNWYDFEHIPLRMALPDFCSAQRYKAKDGNAYLAIYEIRTIEALTTRAYQKVKAHPSEETKWMLKNVENFTRYTCDQISQFDKGDAFALDAAVVYAVWFTVPQDRLQDFDDWYEKDHIPLLMECEDWLMVRRFEVISSEPQPYNRLAIHYLRNSSALDAPARVKARSTPWRARLAAESWFKGTYAVFDRCAPRQMSIPTEK